MYYSIVSGSGRYFYLRCRVPGAGTSVDIMETFSWLPGDQVVPLLLPGPIFHCKPSIRIDESDLITQMERFPSIEALASSISLCCAPSTTSARPAFPPGLFHPAFSIVTTITGLFHFLTSGLPRVFATMMILPTFQLAILLRHGNHPRTLCLSKHGKLPG